MCNEKKKWVSHQSLGSKTEKNVPIDRRWYILDLILLWCALYFYYSAIRQETLWLHDLCLQVLTVHGNELHLFFFGPGISLYSNYMCRAFDIAAVGTNTNVSKYNALLWRDSNSSPTRQWADTLRVWSQ